MKRLALGLLVGLTRYGGEEAHLGEARQPLGLVSHLTASVPQQWCQTRAQRVVCGVPCGAHRTECSAHGPVLPPQHVARHHLQQLRGQNPPHWLSCDSWKAGTAARSTSSRVSFTVARSSSSSAARTRARARSTIPSTIGRAVHAARLCGSKARSATAGCWPCAAHPATPCGGEASSHGRRNPREVSQEPQRMAQQHSARCELCECTSTPLL
jgi:hypothetical protein